MKNTETVNLSLCSISKFLVVLKITTGPIFLRVFEGLHVGSHLSRKWKCAFNGKWYGEHFISLQRPKIRNSFGDNFRTAFLAFCSAAMLGAMLDKNGCAHSPNVMWNILSLYTTRKFEVVLEITSGPCFKHFVMPPCWKPCWPKMDAPIRSQMWCRTFYFFIAWKNSQ